MPTNHGTDQTLLARWNDTRRDYGADLCLHEHIEAQAARTPLAVAVTFGGAQLTYRQLNERANQLARALRKRGVGPEVTVGVFMERSLELVIALLGVLKAGGAYVPLDPSHPEERVALMVVDLAAPVILTQRRLAARLPAQQGAVLCVDDAPGAFENEARSDLAALARPGNLAYVIYTSGSTGVPKGAMNAHRAICNRLLWMQEMYRLGPEDRVLQKTPFSFDVSVWEFFWPLMVGARLVVATPEGHRDPAYLAKLIHDEAVTTLHFVPSLLQSFLDTVGSSRVDLQACKLEYSIVSPK